MTRFFMGICVALLLTIPYFSKHYVPDFEQTHNAFVCNYLGTVCRDKMSVLPVSWQRYTP